MGSKVKSQRELSGTGGNGYYGDRQWQPDPRASNRSPLDTLPLGAVSYGIKDSIRRLSSRGAWGDFPRIRMKVEPAFFVGEHAAEQVAGLVFGPRRHRGRVMKDLHA